ncbi:MAG: LysR family transcriptional regulator [Chromatiaceae bacterium]|nr:LysR family transcriptional regulator [Chromatiaceae bacterium]
MADSKKLKHFVVLAECGNFSDAAEKLYLSQPALTRSIQNLEQSLDLQLFDRSQRSIKLTRAGSGLLKYARVVLQDIDNLHTEAQKINNLESGRVVIGSGPLPAEHICAAACAKMLNTYPQIRLALRVDDPLVLIKRLIEGQIDLAVVDVRAVQQYADIAFEPLPVVPALTVVRNGHPLLQFDTVDAKLIRQYPLATISLLAKEILSAALDLLPNQSGELFSFECNSVQLMLHTLKNSDAVGFLLNANVQDAISRGELGVVNFDKINHKVHSQYGIATYKPRLNSLAVDKFISVTKEIAVLS